MFFFFISFMSMKSKHNTQCWQPKKLIWLNCVTCDSESINHPKCLLTFGSLWEFLQKCLEAVPLQSECVYIGIECHICTFGSSIEQRLHFVFPTPSPSPSAPPFPAYHSLMTTSPHHTGGGALHSNLFSGAQSLHYNEHPHNKRHTMKMLIFLLSSPLIICCDW